MTGVFRGSVTFGGSYLNSEGSDVFVASLTSSGAHRWSTAGGGSSDDSSSGVALDDAGNVYVTGTVDAAASFGGAVLEPAGAADIFLASYDASGGHRWSRLAGGPNVDSGSGIAASPSGDVYSTGYAEPGPDFGGGALDTDVPVAFVAAHQSMDGTHRSSFGIGGPEGGVQGQSVVVGGGRVCIGGSINGSVSIGEVTLISIDTDAFIACFEP